jgi:hypothetical protein
MKTRNGLLSGNLDCAPPCVGDPSVIGSVSWLQDPARQRQATSKTAIVPFIAVGDILSHGQLQ